MEKAIIKEIKGTLGGVTLVLQMSTSEKLEYMIQNGDLSFFMGTKGKTCQVVRKGKTVQQVLLDGKDIAQQRLVFAQNSSSNNQQPHSQSRPQPTPQPKHQTQSRSQFNSQSQSQLQSKRSNQIPPRAHTGNQASLGNIITHVADMATAPYNFIPLNDKVVPAQFQQKDDFPGFDQYHPERLTGRIELEIETLTPLYIRGSQGATDKSEQRLNSAFFSPGGQLKIPGSSLRGMVRTLLEIVGYGKFGPGQSFDNKTLYYRSLADNCISLKNEYRSNMSSQDRQTGSTNYKFDAGYLTKEGFDYFVIPAVKKDGKQFTKIRKPAGSKRKFEYEKRNDDTFLVISGMMQGKKHDWVINEPDLKAGKIPLDEMDVKAYEKDENRYYDKETKDDAKRLDGDLFRMLKESPYKMVPCFYVQWRDNSGRDRVSFGHTGYFRLAYRQTIADCVPKELTETKFVDLPEAIFGRLQEPFGFASRVFFEDANLINDPAEVIMPPTTPQILSSPKPTTFQHYLEQKGKNTKTLNHYNNPGARIRGYKLYWHRNTPNEGMNRWNVDGLGNSKVGSQYTLIQAVKPGTRFQGSIRFENLSEEELGALLFVLKLPANHHHKLGMGKPLGLGTIKIYPKVFTSNRKERYTSLLSAGDWNLAEQENQSDAYVEQFADYVLKKLGLQLPQTKESALRLWKEPRLQALLAMLNWENTKRPQWNLRTKYLELNEFRQRKILPTPEEVTKQQ